MDGQDSLQQCQCCQRYFRSVIQHLRQSNCGSVVRQQNNSCCISLVPQPALEQDTRDDNTLLNYHHDNQDEDDILGGLDDELNNTLPEEMELPCYEINAEDENNNSGTNACYFPHSRLQKSFACDPQLVGYTKILAFLNELNAPKYAFGSLLELLTELYNDRFNFGAQHRSRESILKKLNSLFPTSKIERIPVTLESSHENKPIVYVYRFDFENQLRDLLREDLFFDVNNLVVNSDDPFGKYKPPDGLLNEVNSGEWYSRTYDEYVNDHAGTRTILPLKLYCDKTGVDPMMQRHALEPVMFSTTIISRQMQQQSEKSWRHIGFIPDLDKLCVSAKASSSKHQYDRGLHVRNYHKCLDILLQPIVELQKQGLIIHLQIGDYYQKTKAFFPIAIIAGDSKSNDLWCGRVSHYKQPRMSRACYTSYLECNNPWFRCQWVKQSTQLKLQLQLKEEDARHDDELMEQLRKQSTYRCWSSLFHIDFGCNKYGQFGACTVDPMHMFESGILAMVCKSFVELIGGSKQRKLDEWAYHYCKKNRSSAKKYFPRVDFSGGVTRLTNIASHEWAGILLVYLLAVCSISGNKFLHSKFDNIDKIFEKRVVREKEKRSKQRKRQHILKSNNLQTRGEILQQVSTHPLEQGPESDFYASDDCEQNVDDVTIVRCTREKFIQMCEMLLCFHAYYKRGKFWCVGDTQTSEEFDHSIRKMMEQVVNSIHRGDNSNNWNLQKFHELLHLARQVKEYGHICNSDTAFGERGLKVWAKQPGRRSLKGNVDIFTESTTVCLQESITINKAMNAFLSDNLPSNSNSKSSSVTDIGSTTRFLHKPKFELSLVWDENLHDHKVICKTSKHVKTKKPLELCNDVLDILREEYFCLDDVADENQRQLYLSRSIKVYTGIILPTGEKLIAHPNYMDHGPQYDFAILKNDQTDDILLDDSIPSYLHQKFPNHVPCRLICFYTVSDINIDMAVVMKCRNRTTFNQDRDTVLTESWNFETVPVNYTVRDDGSLVSEPMRHRPVVTRLEYEYQANIQIKNIETGIYAIPDGDMFETHMKNSEATGHILVVKDRDEYWAEEFF